MKKLITLSFLILFSFSIFSQYPSPKREFRGAWVASVVNLDWPSSPSLSTQAQKDQLILLLDELKKSGINAVVFQIRPECDALYNSPYEPWSYWLTGSQGVPPNPYYDPLEFAIEETHKRGMELHAWFNPYRAVRSVGTFNVSSQHITVQHPDWILTFGTLKILNPGLPQVRDYNTEIIMDVVRRYNIDGVHFDDYFYPYPPNHMTSSSAYNALDDAAFASDPRGFTNKNDWRRDNVNIQMEQIHDSIITEKPFIKFGISPFGIWKNGVPPGIVGMDAYNVIYADPMAWLQDRTVDYLTPQLYWRIGGGQDYSKLMPWWADSVYANERHLYTGHILNANFSNNELPSQIQLNRNNFKVEGSVWFRADLLNANALGLRDSLRNNYYKYPALLPIMDWKDIVPPNAPQNLRFERLAGTSRSSIAWDGPSTAGDGDSASWYVIYLFNTSSIQPGDLDDAKKIINVTGEKLYVPVSSPNFTAPYYFVVTSLDRNNNESGMSSIIQITAPQIPSLVSPSNGSINLTDTIIVSWNYSEGSSFYQLQVSSDPNFTGNFLINSSSLADTFYTLAGMNGLTKYYWRIKSINIAGESSYSSVFDFTTGFPVTPLLADPPHATLEVSLNLALKWNSSEASDSYQLQLSISLTFNSSTILLDTAGIIDTSYTLSNLTPNQNHFWRVRGSNQYGASQWSETFGFKTMNVTAIEYEDALPENYSLEQNYPNPFNPSTKIKFALPNQVHATLKIYDLLGNEIAVLVDENLAQGIYSVEFDASELSSGTYIYKLSAGEFVQVKKMMMIK